MPGITERLLYRVAKRWIAGYNLEDAIIDAQRTNEKKMAAIVNRLGEHTPDRKLIEEYVGEYLRLLDRMHEANVVGAISVKPSQLGLTAEKSCSVKISIEFLTRQGRRSVPSGST